MFKPLHVWSSKKATINEEKKSINKYEVKKIEENKFV